MKKSPKGRANRPPYPFGTPQTFLQTYNVWFAQFLKDHFVIKEDNLRTYKPPFQELGD
jgi:hypothetical protein